MMLVFFAYMPYQNGDENLIVDKRIRPSGNTNICSGQSVRLRTIQGIGYTYQWYLNGNPISGATGYDYTATAAGSYTVMITSATTNALSDPVLVNVLTPSPASISPIGFTLYSPNDSLLLSAGTGTGFTYQWYLNGTAIQGAIDSTYMANTAGDYTVMINNGGCFSQSQVSTGILSSTSVPSVAVEDPTITVYPNPARGPVTVETTCTTHLTVFDVKGRVVLENSLSAGRHELLLSVTGTYLLKFIDSEGRQTNRRVTVQR
jgi:hypothetical protein